MLPARTVLLLTLLLTFSLHHSTGKEPPATAVGQGSEALLGMSCWGGQAGNPSREWEWCSHPGVQGWMEKVLGGLSKARPGERLFLTASGDEICADPEKQWVKKAIKRLQRKI
uniref:Uncharacterized protein n=1 Tax=Corvus moneduloides TaxID=1196302 RepID=A0A8U7M6D0_CORMO